MYICMCSNVDCSKLKKACEKYGDNIEKILKKTRIGTCCGKCLPKAYDLIDRYLQEKEEEEK